MQVLITMGILFIYATMLTILFKKRIEETIPISIVEMILIIYITGIFDNLKLGIEIIEIMAMIQIAIILYLLCKQKEKAKIVENLERILTPGLVVYIILCLILMYINKGRIFEEHDEFTHWGIMIKNMFLYNTYGTNTESLVTFNEYPPFTAIFQYLFLAIKGIYTEDIIITAQGILYLSIISPIMKNIKWDKSIKKLMIVVPIIIALPMIFCKDFYLEILVDGILGIMFGITIFYAFEDEENEKFKYIKILTGIIMLALTKTSGIALAVLVLAIIFIKQIKDKKRIKPLIIIGIIVVALTAMWYVKTRKAEKTWDFSKYIEVVHTEESEQITKKFIYESFLEQCITEKNLTVCAVFLIFICSHIYLIKIGRKEVRYYSKAMLISVILYMAILQISYIAIFDPMEAQNLDCFDRYASTILLSVSTFQIFVLLEAKKEMNRKTILVLLTCLLCILPQKNILQKYVDAKNYIFRQENNRDYNTKMKRYKTLLTSDDKILYINSVAEQIGYIGLINQYEVMPTKIEENIGTFESIEKLQNKLLEGGYTHLYIYRMENEVKETIKGIFEEEEIINDTLYKVTKREGTIFLEKEN